LIVDWISNDIGLASQIIKAINSPFFGLSENIASIEHAVRLFGLSKLKDMIIQPAYRKAMEESITGFEAISEYSHQVGTMAEIIAKDIEGIPTGLAYMTGLFHEAGSLILGANHPDHKHLFEKYRTEPLTWPEVERKEFGSSHTAIGVLLAKHWGMSTMICNCIYLHHTPLSKYENIIGYESISLTSVLKYASYLTVKNLLVIDVEKSEECSSLRNSSVEELMLDEETISSHEMDSKMLCADSY